MSSHPAEWISGSPLLARAYELAERAHGDERRASDGQRFLDHVTEVATLLHEAGFDDELVAAGLLHDSVERGTLSERELRDAMGDDIAAVVMPLTEDSSIDAFAERKAALRRQVAAAGGRAVAVFAADKLSDILGLRRGLETRGDGIEARLGASAATMAAHYRESVAMIESERAGAAVLPVLRAELELLADTGGHGFEAPPARRDTGREWKRARSARLTG